VLKVRRPIGCDRDLGVPTEIHATQQQHTTLLVLEVLTVHN
jgi:hypothetical protein